MHHRGADRDAIGKCATGKLFRPAWANLDFRQSREIAKCARGHHFGQDHRDGLQRLDFVFAVNARHLVLHHEHTECALRAHDRHAEERAVRIFACFWTIRETLVVRCVGDIERLRRLSDKTDETFAELQARAVHGGWI